MRHTEIKLISRNILDSVDRYEPIKILGNVEEHRRVFEFSKARVIRPGLNRSKHVEDEKDGEGRERERERKGSLPSPGNFGESPIDAGEPSPGNFWNGQRSDIYSIRLKLA